MSKKCNIRSVWAIQESFNDYDQHGPVLRALFSSKPSIEQLVKWLTGQGELGFSDAMEALDYVMWLQKGGGRRNYEHSWFELEEIPLVDQM